MYQRSRNNWIKHIDFMALDVLCFHIAYVISYCIRFPVAGLPYADRLYLELILAISVILILSSLILQNHSNILRRGWLKEFLKVVAFALTAFALTSLYMFSAHIAVEYSRLVLYYSFIAFILFDWLARMGYKRFVIRRMRNAADSDDQKGRSLLILTDAVHASEIILDIRNDFWDQFRIQGVVLTDGETDQTDVDGVPVVAKLDNAAAYICRKWIDEVLIYLPEQAAMPRKFLDECAEMGITVHLCVNVHGFDLSKQFMEEIGDHAVLSIAYSFIEPHQAFIKRVADIVGGLIGTLAAVLIGVFVMPFVLLQSPGPILFKQDRVGKNGKIFKMLKFRSMYLDAEERKEELLSQNRIQDGMMFKMDFDPRVIGNRILPNGMKKTGIGEFIRRTSLDEFPQFFNVLKGDMSLVGTRPPTVDEWNRYEYHHRARLSIKPGLTGLWQISGRSDITDFEEVVKLDTKYITNFRLGLDCRILLQTIAVLFRGKGAY